MRVDSDEMVSVESGNTQYFYTEECRRSRTGSRFPTTVLSSV